jgi:hypothetical protein
VGKTKAKEKGISGSEGKRAVYVRNGTKKKKRNRNKKPNSGTSVNAS